MRSSSRLTVLGELYVGVNRVANRAKHLKKLRSFLSLCEVILVDTATSERFGEISALLYKKGKPIPSNDIWIAATAMQHNLVLATMDKHFHRKCRTWPLRSGERKLKKPFR